jgi:hypothetical protein
MADIVHRLIGSANYLTLANKEHQACGSGMPTSARLSKFCARNRNAITLTFDDSEEHVTRKVE